MILRFKRLSGEIIFELNNPGEHDIPPPDSYISVNEVEYRCVRHKRVYDQNFITKESSSFFDIYVQTEEEYQKEMNDKLNESLPSY